MDTTAFVQLIINFIKYIFDLFGVTAEFEKLGVDINQLLSGEKKEEEEPVVNEL